MGEHRAAPPGRFERPGAARAVAAPRRRPGRPRGADSAHTRRVIVSAAAELIGRQGFGATSMAQVANAAGLSATGLNHHFASKSSLLAAVLEYRDEVDLLALAEGDARGPWEYLDHVVHVARVNAGKPAIVQLFTTVAGEATSPDHPAHRWMRAHYSTVLAMVRDGIDRDQRAGHVHPEAPAERIARELVALMDGYQTQWLLEQEVDMPSLLEEYVADVKARWSVAGGSCADGDARYPDDSGSTAVP